MLTRVARPFGAPSSGFPAASGTWVAVHSREKEDGPNKIPAFGKKNWREFLYAFQPSSGQHYGKEDSLPKWRKTS
jgi:hypothetical protein